MRPFYRASAILILALSLLITREAFGFAERVRSIRADGSLEMESGEAVRLYGIRLSDEALRFLPVLLAGKDVSFEVEDEDGLLLASGPKPVYLYAEMDELDLPYDPDSKPRSKKVMVNELLITMGAAEVLDADFYKWKYRFLELQDEARRKGEGIWSYASAESLDKVDRVLDGRMGSAPSAASPEAGTHEGGESPLPTES